MTQKHEELLLKDICGRIPYGVIGKFKNNNQQIYGIFHDLLEGWQVSGITLTEYISTVKPYLFPLSSMTEEQRKEFLEISHLENRSFYNREEIVIVSNEVWMFDLGGDADTEYRSIDIKRIRETVKWLDKNYFDWRGLIPMGLAEDATNKNIY